MVKKTQSFKVEERLWKDVKIHCIENDIEISKFLEESLIKKLGEKNE